VRQRVLYVCVCIASHVCLIALPVGLAVQMVDSDGEDVADTEEFVPVLRSRRRKAVAYDMDDGNDDVYDDMPKPKPIATASSTSTSTSTSTSGPAAMASAAPPRPGISKPRAVVETVRAFI
jgi:hypothetical protein